MSTSSAAQASSPFIVEGDTPAAAHGVSVNGRSERVFARTLQSLLGELGFEGEWLGTAVNGELVTRAERAAHPIADGDRIEILSPMQGG